MQDTRWQDQLCCVLCQGRLSRGQKCLECGSCGFEYEMLAEGVPVMMTPEDRKRFGLALENTKWRMGKQYERRHGRGTVTRLFRTLSPPEPVYIDPSAPALPEAESGINLWLGGGGLDTGGFINVDLSLFHGVNLIAHAGRLPFPERSCDRIACLALLEHVPSPEEVVGEIYRVLKPDGLIEAVVPFCHPYHAYPTDYSRFSREGLASLFEDFAGVKIGIRTGPTTTILTFMTYYGKLIFPVHCQNTIRRWFNRGIMGVFGWITAPLSYLDHWLNRLPDAHILANHFYVIARKPPDA